MNPLTKLVEAALFSATRPLTLTELRALEPNATKAELHDALADLARAYDEGGHGVEVVEIGGGYQTLTRPELAEAITEARIVHRPRKLSAAAMETLAIIGYRQPVGRAEIEEIRGVAADGVLRSLLERGLVDIVGRAEGLGRPLLYGTTQRFLEMVGLNDPSELPRLDELSVALRPIDQVFPELGERAAASSPEPGEDQSPVLGDGDDPLEVQSPERGDGADAIEASPSLSQGGAVG